MKAANYDANELEAEVQTSSKLRSDQEMNSLSDIFNQFEKANESSSQANDQES
jgi:hypothetical protein